MDRKPTTLCALVAGLLCGLVPWSAAAGIDAPGTVSFQWLSDQEQVLREFPDIPESEPYFEARAFFSSDASTFGPEDGVLMWAGFELTGPEGPGYGMLLIDMDLGLLPPDLDTPMRHDAVRAEYVETFNDQVTFEGRVVTGDVWLVDVVFHEDDKGAVEGDFALIFGGVDESYFGCRVLVRGRFITSPSPARVVGGRHGTYDDPEGDVVYVDTGCSGDVYVADDTGEGCDCGGTDPDPDTGGGGGCEGDTGSGCAGDGGGCEGDTGGGCAGSGSSGGCAGDVSGGGACSGADACSHTGSTLRPGRNGRPLSTLLRFFPELAVLLFIWGLRRRV